MSDYLDQLGPQVAAANASDAVGLRDLVRVYGPVRVVDEPERARATLVVPDFSYRVITVPASALETPFVEASGFSDADLVRLDVSGSLEGGYMVQSIVDAGSPVNAPRKFLKYLANVGTRPIMLQPLPPDDAPPPRVAGFLNTLELLPGRTVRVVWDAVQQCYRIRGGATSLFRLVTLDGDPVTIDGMRIVLV